VLLWVERNLETSLAQGATFTDPDGLLDGVLLFYQGEIRDGQGEIAGTRLFALFADPASDQVRPINPAILWDLVPDPISRSSKLDSGRGESDIESLKRQAWGFLLPGLEAYRQSLLKERERQANIKEKYGVQSLERLVLKLDGDLIVLYDRRERGENVDLVIRNKEEQKQHYEHALVDLQQNLSRERNLTLSAPRFLGAVRVLPAAGAGEMASDPEVERIAMQKVMAYERQQGRLPEDVSTQNLGFDIRSNGTEGQRRYIEVKGRAGSGSVALTQNEWFKAQRFQGEYYLYVVLNTASMPLLYIIQNPAGILRPEEQVEVRFLVSLNEITSKGARD
jgi:hypothetical protein